MNRAELLFKAIDIIGNPIQNAVRFKNVVCKKDIPYGELPANKGDLYYREDIISDGEKHPVILYYHGGGFIKGDKKYRVSVSEFYADKGYFVYCVNYRLAPEGGFRELMLDCVSALNYVTDLSEKYNIDTDNIVVTGDSSGAFISSYVTALCFDEALRNGVNCIDFKVNIKAAMFMCGIYDLEVLMKGTTLFGVIPVTAKMFMQFDLKKDFSNLSEYEYYDYLSPSDFVNKNWCPVFICWAEDDIICQNQGEPMAQKLKANAPLCETHCSKGMINNHCYHLVLNGSKYAKDCMRMSVEFLEKVLVKEPAMVE